MGLLERASRMRVRRGSRPGAAGTPGLGLADLHSPRRVDAPHLVSVLVFQGVTTTEIDEPVRRVADELDADVLFVGTRGVTNTVVGIEPVRSVHVDVTVDDPIALNPDILVIPGGLGWERLVNDHAVMTWLIHAATAAGGVLAISTGSLLLASAGRLVGRAATGHWLARDALAALGADVRCARTVRTGDDRIVTASGATAACEVTTALAQRVRWGPA